MLVKKVNPEWKPSENPGIQVGETIEITNPKTLIISGDVVAIDSDGIEISAYDLYGVVVKTEMDEFIEYKKMKQAEETAKKLAKEKADLEALKKDAEKKEETVNLTAPVIEPVTSTVTSKATPAKQTNKK